jgi:hypothetical protein
MKFPVRSSRCAAIAVALVTFSVTANGQTPTPSPGVSSTPVKTDASTPKEDQGKQKSNTAGQIANATRNAMPGSSPSAARIVRIRQGDELSVDVSDLKERLERQPDPAKITLFLNCIPVKGIKPTVCPSEKKVLFTLNRKDLRQITENTKIVSVGISFTDTEKAELVMPEKVQLVFVAFGKESFFAVVIILLMAAVLWFYGRHTNLLRDGQGSGSTAANSTPGLLLGGGGFLGWRSYLQGFRTLRNTRPLALYSLAKVQMAWWLFFIIAAFLFIWVAVGDYNTVTTSTLVLFGISVGTAVTSKVIDANKQSNAQELKATKAALEQQVAQVSAQPAAPAGAAPAPAADVQMKAIQLEQVKAQLKNLTTAPEEAISQGFFTDIMSDENGVSIHRFQMVAWTIVLTLIFGYEVYKTLSMPEFSNTLLTLMGISSGTYVTLKVPEKHSVVSR